MRPRVRAVSDVDDFIRKNKPGTKRSRLFPHLPAIHRLRAEGFSFDQVCQFLREKGVPITVSGLSSYLKRHEQLVEGNQQSLARNATALGDADIARTGDQEFGEAPQLERLDKKQRRERLADQFINSETSNPLLKRMKENKA